MVVYWLNQIFSKMIFSLFLLHFLVGFILWRRVFPFPLNGVRISLWGMGVAAGMEPKTLPKLVYYTSTELHPIPGVRTLILFSESSDHSPDLVIGSPFKPLPYFILTCVHLLISTFLLCDSRCTKFILSFPWYTGVIFLRIWILCQGIFCQSILTCFHKDHPASGQRSASVLSLFSIAITEDHRLGNL